MALALQDIRRAKLIALGYSGSVRDMEYAFYKFESGATGSFNDVQYAFLAVKGFSVGSLNDRWRAYLLSLGYLGSLNDMLVFFWTNYTVGGSSFLLQEDGFFILLEDGSKLIL